MGEDRNWRVALVPNTLSLAAPNRTSSCSSVLSRRVATSVEFPCRCAGQAKQPHVQSSLHRGVKIEIITPGADIDARTVRAVGKARWKPLLQADARFYEYQPARFHCKYLLVDDCWASFGSANLDNRSMSLNEEANLNVLDRQFVTSYAKISEEDKSHAHEVALQDWRHRPWEEKIKGRAMSIFRSQM